MLPSSVDQSASNSSSVVEYLLSPIPDALDDFGPQIIADLCAERLMMGHDVDPDPRSAPYKPFDSSPLTALLAEGRRP